MGHGIQTPDTGGKAGANDAFVPVKPRNIPTPTARKQRRRPACRWIIELAV